MYWEHFSQARCLDTPVHLHTHTHTHPLPGHVAQSVGHRGAGFDTRFGHILLFLLLLIQKGKLSATGESICTKYWLTAKEV